LLGDRIALMEEGRLIVDLPAAEFSRSQHPLVRAYVEAFSGLPDESLADERLPDPD
jgi:ABC-type transporter Mla maintaining outer membrane lipid asymmetry ATPase subunit MlaF